MAHRRPSSIVPIVAAVAAASVVPAGLHATEGSAVPAHPTIGHTVTHDAVFGYADVSFSGLPAVSDDGLSVAHRPRVDERYHAVGRPARIGIVSTSSNAPSRALDLGVVGELGEDPGRVRAVAARLERRASVVEERLRAQRYRAMQRLGRLEGEGALERGGLVVRLDVAPELDAKIVVQDATAGRERARVLVGPPPAAECEGSTTTLSDRATPDAITVWYDAASATVALQSEYRTGTAACADRYRFDVARLVE